MNNINDCKSMTPLRTPGGKSKVVKKLLSPLFPTEFNDYYEPFIGGGSVALFLKQMYPEKNVYINDLNYNLYTFWKILKQKPFKLIEKLHEVRLLYDPNDLEQGKELLNTLKELLNDDDEFTIAYSFYILNKISFSGLTEHGSLSKSAYNKTYNHGNIDKLKMIYEVMKDFHIYNEHFKEFMKNSKQNDFTFLDPPYLIDSSNLYGKDGDLHKNFNHLEFLESVKNLKGKWMLTYNDCEWIRTKYKDYNIQNAEYRYCMAFKEDDQGNKLTRVKNELIITNY